jgi:carbamoyltransferase
MLILGLCGGMDRLHETTFARYNKDIHDSAAVLLEDGRVVAAIEQERLDRIKHSNKFPADAVRFCLRQRGATLRDVDRIVLVNREETTAKYVTWMHFTLRQHVDLLGAFDWVQTLCRQELDEDVPKEKIVFVGHHQAHAMSAFVCSGYERGLVVTLDGLGDTESGTINLGDRRQGLRLLRDYTIDQSLGVFYQRVCYFLGFKAFSEFKVMGLAPYGDASRYRRYFEGAYTILPDGNYRADFTKLFPLLSELAPRKPQDPIAQEYKDVAASLQEMLEKIVFAVLRHYRRQTQEPRLALAGGVAHNCALNGRLLYSQLFDRIYVQPAAHDGGTALGAALTVHAEVAADRGSAFDNSSVYWGRGVEACTQTDELDAWRDFLLVDRLNDEEALTQRAAATLAAGQVIGWVQGRSEFGPRALGNRSILADPRPAANREIINAMVKKREAFRPFAPAVLEEALHEYFDVPSDVTDLSFMTFAVKVKKDKRAVLGAVTHVDGTARVQTVSKRTNEQFWRLIDAFKRETGVPVLLNTSFNNNAEPIVDSVEDAIVCFLTTGLHQLVVDDALVSKRSIEWRSYLPLAVTLQGWVVLAEIHQSVGDGRFETMHVATHQMSMPATWKESREILSPELYRALRSADGCTSIGDLMHKAGITDPTRMQALVEELQGLWAKRYVRLRPSRSSNSQLSESSSERRDG